ncbi:hypothetical protein JCM33374_g1998 [Metschnikowia sp. JCM 33374]|nr:hypothetical protein JCM33374_g1998 [Metschnikowia sp. JCM 33374]
MYFAEGPTGGVEHLLTRDPDKLMRSIFRGGTWKHLPKRYRGLSRVLRSAQKNDRSLRYRYILNNIVQRQQLHESVFDNAVPFSQVTRLVFTCVHRVFPNDTFGCQHNWNIINETIYTTLKTDRTEGVDVRELVQRLKVTSIPWLGKSPRPTSKQDHLSRINILHQFLGWFFASFLVRLVARFWYVTENPLRTKSTQPCNAFFLHKSWKSLSSLWLDQYAEKYLEEATDPDDIVCKTAPFEFNFGVLRLVPKKSDFRPLCIPSKVGRSTVDADEITRAKSKKEHTIYDYTVIRPIRDILRSQQQKLLAKNSSAFPRCNSVNDVGRSVAHFKAQPNDEIPRTAPPFYGVQFDMKHCYDNLNQGKILFCIGELFSGDSVSEEYIVRKYAHASNSGTKHTTTRSIIKNRANVQEVDMFEYNPTPNHHDSVYGDRLRTLKFTRSNVLDLVRSQVLDATTEIPKSGDSTYKRTRGVFQGFPLSGTLCDIVYNSLVDNVMAKVRNKDHDCLLLRLADDFLFISTSHAACKNMLELARCREAKEYGAHVNHEKISWINASENGCEHAHFLGLSIDFRTLSIERAENSIVSISQTTRRSLNASLAYLNWRFKLKIADYLFNLNLSDFDTVSKNACQVYIWSLKAAIKCTLRNPLEQDTIDQLVMFAFETLLATLQKFQFVNGKSDLCQKLFKNICKMVKAEFKEQGIPTDTLEHLLSM